MSERLKNMKLLIAIVVIVLGFGGLLFITQSKNNKIDSPSMSIQTIKSDIARGGQMLDVRTPSEYKSSHIDGAINLPLQDIQSGKVPNIAKDKTVYLYCRSGSRSSEATVVLKAAGYKNIIDLGAMAHVQSLGGIIKS